MNDLRQLLNEHLATRRALGARLVPAGRLLERFVALVIQCESDFLTVCPRRGVGQTAFSRATRPMGEPPGHGPRLRP